MQLPRPAQGTLKWWLIGGLWVVVACSAIVWVALVRVPQQVSPQVTGFSVLPDGSVVVDYDLRRPADTTVECLVTALDFHHGRVGAATDAVPPGPSAGTVHRTVTVRTSAPAVTGLVDSCVRRGS
jgi:hypothetical protein